MDGDADLVGRAQRGEEQAFAELLRRHSEPVFRLAVSILGQEFVPEAEDVTQEVFLKFHQKLGSFRGESAFSSWIYRITFNEAVNVKARMRFRTPHLHESALGGLSSKEPEPHGLAEVAIREKVVAECVAELPEVYQSSLRLYYWMGEGVSEVATLLNVPENTAKSYLYRARQLLGAMLKERGFNDE